MNSNQLKACLQDYRHAMSCFDPDLTRAALDKNFAEQAIFKMCHPFERLEGTQAWLQECLLPLHAAFPDLERREMILMAGVSPEGHHWVGSMGNYMGTFVAPFLDIPATGHLAHMRYHEFFRIEDQQVVEVQAIWDLPELMMQANAWPMAPQLGAFLCTPAPMTGDGLSISGDGEENYNQIISMLTDLCQHPGDPDPAVMNLDQYWHPRFNWYGPCGIGTSRGVSGFRNWHQIPFLRAMPDRQLDSKSDRTSEWEIDDSHWVAEGNYVCETGWPNMQLSLTGDGWMGIAPQGTPVTLRSLDFWRLEDGLIRENWVLVDLLNLYHQIGVDVLARLSEFNKARTLGAIQVPSGLAVVQ